jgi:hypothetical protein
MFIPDPDFFPHQPNKTKRRDKKNICAVLLFFVAFRSSKIVNYLILYTCTEKDLRRLTKCSLPKKLFLSPRKYGQGPEAGKTYPDTGSGSATQIIAICLEVCFLSLCDGTFTETSFSF